MRERSHWIIVGSPDNFEITRKLGFTLQGIKSRHRKKAEQMAPGDGIAYYITGLKAFAATATITSTFFEDHEPIWRSNNPKKAQEDYPFRVGIEPDIVLPEGMYIPAEPVARRLTHVSRWPAENWTLAFQGNVHRISHDDFAIIRNALSGAIPAAASGH